MRSPHRFLILLLVLPLVCAAEPATVIRATLTCAFKDTL